MQTRGDEGCINISLSSLSFIQTTPTVSVYRKHSKVTGIPSGFTVTAEVQEEGLHLMPHSYRLPASNYASNMFCQCPLTVELCSLQPRSAPSFSPFRLGSWGVSTFITGETGRTPAAPYKEPELQSNTNFLNEHFCFLTFRNSIFL